MSNINFSEYGYFAYHIKGNEAYNNMFANILPLHTSLTPGVGCQHVFIFSKRINVAYQINGDGA